MYTRIQKHNILNSKASICNVTFTQMQEVAIEQAMEDYSLTQLEAFRADQSKSVNLEAIRLFPALYKSQFKLWLRKRAFLKAKKQAIIMAAIENRPFYVIRATEIAYVVQSTLEARNLRKRRIYSRHATSTKLHETSDFTAYPDSRKPIPTTRERGVSK